jgi:holo-[acyl-carrier protein] synthase
MLGVDIVSIGRIEAFYKKYGQNALKRYLHPQEIAIAKSDATRAGFWAAKEAVAKALGCGIGQVCSFHDITIFKDKKGAPHCKLSSKLIEEFCIKECAISISHDGGFAIAVAAITTSSSTDKL